MRFLLDTNILSNMVRNPHGHIAQRVEGLGRSWVCTSIIVAAELRYGAAKKASARLTAQLEEILNNIDVLSLEPPVDTVYGNLRARLDKTGRMLSANDLLIAAHALSLDYTLVTDNEREFLMVETLRVQNWLRDPPAPLEGQPWH